MRRAVKKTESRSYRSSRSHPLEAGLLVFCVLNLAGCKRAPELHVTSAAAPTLEAGWGTAESPDHTVSIGFPPGWRAGADTPAGSVLEMAANAGGQNPMAGGADVPSTGDSDVNQQMQALADKARQDDEQQEQKALAELAKKGIVINVINGSKPVPGEERTRFYVKVTHDSGSVSLQQAIETERSHYAFSPKPTQVKLPIGNAERFAADDSLKDGMTLHQISYVVVDGGGTYTLRFVTEEDIQAIQSIADSVAATWRVMPNKRW